MAIIGSSNSLGKIAKIHLTALYSRCDNLSPMFSLWQKHWLTKCFEPHTQSTKDKKTKNGELLAGFGLEAPLMGGKHFAPRRRRQGEKGGNTGIRVATSM